MSVAVLLVVSGSLVRAVTVAVFVSVLTLFGTVTAISTVAVAPLGKIPRSQTIGVVPKHVPRLGDADTKFTPAGRVSVTVTPEVVAGIVGIPLLVTVR